jgi:hypothetical protein
LDPYPRSPALPPIAEADEIAPLLPFAVLGKPQ